MIYRDKIIEVLKLEPQTSKQLKHRTFCPHIYQILNHMKKQGYIKKDGNLWVIDTPPKKYTVIETKRKRIRVYE
jgi:hypothetical protein